MSGKHVLFVPSWYPTPQSPTNGIFFQDQARCLASGGYQVGVIAVETRRWRSQQGGSQLSGLTDVTDRDERGVRVVRATVMNVVPRRWRAARWLRRTCGLAEQYATRYGMPDVLHAQSTLWGGYAALLLARQWGRPMVITEHSSAFFSGFIRGWECRLIRSACATPTRVLAVSPGLAAAVADIAGGQPPVVVPNLVDTDFFAPSSTPSTDPVDLLCVAHLDRKKGVDVLLSALSVLEKEGLRLSLRIVGDGPERASLERSARQLGVADRVTFTGLASRLEVRKAMWNARVFVLPSRVETFGLVLAEAMACGLPVVATRSGGPESFVQEPFGWLVPSDDVASLATALMSASNAERASIARSARSFAVTEFGPSALLSRLGQVYSDLRSR